NERCGPQQVCCVDCDGTGTCLAPGASCAGFACLSKDAGTDGGSGGDASPDAATEKGILCAGTQCEGGHVCCVDCNGQGTCGPPGFVCPGYGCLPDAGSSTVCTPEGQHVQGTVLTITGEYLAYGCLPSTRQLLTSAADVQAAFPGGDAPHELANVD